MSSATVTTGAAASAPVRRRELPGVYNLRDTGGYRAASGSTRWGTLFRSDALHLLDDEGREALVALGITQLVDLRGDDERHAAPSAVAGLGIAIRHIPVFDDASPVVMAHAPVSLESVYRHMVDDRGPQLAAAVRALVDAAPGRAVLVHCTAGKDRTGLVIALALAAVGVDRQEVVDDYAATAAHLVGPWAQRMLAGLTERGLEATPEIVELVTASPASLLNGLLDRIEAEHGSIGGYLRSHGLTGDELARLRAALVDDSAPERNNA